MRNNRRLNGFRGGDRKIYETLGLDSRTFEPYWRNGIKTPKGVYVSAYRDGGRVTYAVSNLTRGNKTVTLPVARCASAKEMISGKSIPADGGMITLDLEPFTPYILDMISKIRKEQINEHE